MIARSEAAQAPASTMSNGVTGNIPECDCTRLARAIRAGAQRQEAAGHARAPARPAARARVPPAPRRGSRSHLVGRVGRASLNAARRLSRAKSTTQARGANREVLRSRAVTTRRMSGASRGLIFSEPKPVLDTDRHRRIGNPKQKLIHGHDGGSYNIFEILFGCDCWKSGYPTDEDGLDCSEASAEGLVHVTAPSGCAGDAASQMLLSSVKGNERCNTSEKLS